MIFYLCRKFAAVCRKTATFCLQFFFQFTILPNLGIERDFYIVSSDIWNCCNSSRLRCYKRFSCFLKL